MQWAQILTSALGIFLGFAGFTIFLAILFVIFDRQETERKERKEITDLNTRVRTLEAENLHLRQQTQAVEEDEDFVMVAPAEVRPLVEVREASSERTASEEPRPTRYDRIEDNDPPPV